MAKIADAQLGLDHFHESVLAAVSPTEVDPKALFGVEGISEATSNAIQVVRVKTATRVRRILRRATLKEMRIAKTPFLKILDAMAENRLRDEVIFESYADQLLDRSMLEAWLAKISTPIPGPFTHVVLPPGTFSEPLKDRLEALCENPGDQILLAYLKAKDHLDIFDALWISRSWAGWLAPAVPVPTPAVPPTHTTTPTPATPAPAPPDKLKPETIIFLCEMERLRHGGVTSGAYHTAALTTLLICEEGTDIIKNGDAALPASHHQKLHERETRWLPKRDGRSLRSLLEEFESMTLLKGVRNADTIGVLMRKGKIDAANLPAFIVTIRILFAEDLNTNPAELEKARVLIRNLELAYFEENLKGFERHSAPETEIPKILEKIRAKYDEEDKKPLRAELPPERGILDNLGELFGKFWEMKLWHNLGHGIGSLLRGIGGIFKKGGTPGGPASGAASAGGHP